MNKLSLLPHLFIAKAMDRLNQSKQESFNQDSGLILMNQYVVRFKIPGDKRKIEQSVSNT